MVISFKYSFKISKIFEISQSISSFLNFSFISIILKIGDTWNILRVKLKKKGGGGSEKTQTFDLYNAENIRNNMAYRTIT